MKRPEQSNTNQFSSVLLTEPDHYLSICQPNALGDVLLMASSPAAGTGIVLLNFTELGELINDLSLLRAKIMLDNETV
jgi:hypothetical protein